MFTELRRSILVTFTALGLALSLFSGCGLLRVPAIDPTGSQVFLPRPNSTTILSPHQNTPVAGPAFTVPATPPPCPDPTRPDYGVPVNTVAAGPPLRTRLASSLNLPSFHRGKRGEIMMTPAKIIAPVNSEIVVMSGICGGDGYYVTNQPLEWMLSQDSVGQFIEVGGMEHRTFNRLLPPSAEKIDGDYAHGRTSLKPKLITRGTPTPVDDIQVVEGQAWISVSSASEGTSYITCVAPNAEAWDKRRATTLVHWVDANWSIPAPSVATAGTVHPLATRITRSSDGSGVPDWEVRYEIIGGVPAEFLPDGASKAKVTTDSDGLAPIQIRQPAGSTQPGTTQVRVDVVRPPLFGEREIVLESGVTTVTWSSPALTIRAIGPRSAGLNQPFNYRIEVSNPGDQVARDVVVRSVDLGDDVEFISSEPKPAQYGNQYQWRLGDVQPGAPATTIDIQLRSGTRGTKRLCFAVDSQSDQLQTETCGETVIAVPCIGLEINGPTEARVGEDITYTFRVVNECNEPLENLTLRVSYDTGLRAATLANPLVLGPITEPIRFGESREFPLTLQVMEPGTRCFDLNVTADGGHTASARRCVDASQVLEQKVKVTVESNKVVSVNQDTLVRMTVENVGNVTLNDVTLMNEFSSSLDPIMRSRVPQQRWIGDNLAFVLGSIEPGQQRVIEIVYRALEPNGDAFSRATVTTPSGASDSAGVSIRIEPAAGFPGAQPGGAPPANEGPIRVPAEGQASGLRVLVVPLDPTVQLPAAGRFRVTVQNDRSVSDQQVSIALFSSAGTSIVGYNQNETGLGIVNQSADGSQLAIETRQELRPGESISFLVAVQPTQPGQANLAVQATSNQSSGTTEGRGSVNFVQ